MPFRLANSARALVGKPQAVVPVFRSSTLPTRDAFGFHKLIAAVTSTGKIFAIDSATGNVTWNHLLAYGEIANSAQDITVKILVPQANQSHHRPELFVVAMITSSTVRLSSLCYILKLMIGISSHKQGQKRSSVFHFDAQTGIPLGAKRSHGLPMSQYDIETGLLDVVVIENSIALIDENYTVCPPLQ